MKYITILESENSKSPNIGTIALDMAHIGETFKIAIEAHFDAELVSFSFVDPNVKNLYDCIEAYPIDVLVMLDDLGSQTEIKVNLSQTWLYECY